MVLEDVLFLNLFKGRRVKLTLKISSYHGVVQRINANKTLVLEDVISSNGCKLPGSKMFFGHEILNVEFINESNTDSGNIHDYKLPENLNVEQFQPYRKTMTLDDENDEEYINFEVIDEFHEKFGPAIMHLKKQHVIGVGADGVEVFQHGRLCWLQIATKNRVYLFDILLLGTRAFKNGLSMILENKHILKVIHDCRAIAGCLIAQFGVKLTHIFDTQVADVMCFYSETGGFLPNRVSTLQEVVSLHLKVPSSQLLSLQMKSQLTKEEREMWQKRPCPVPLLKVMALSVIHLQPLRLVLLDTLMMDYMTLVDSYLHSSHYEPGELQSISMESVLELPKELRQLEQMRSERQEWAADHYPVTDQGLLVRSKPRKRPAHRASPSAQEQSQTQANAINPAPAESPSSTKAHPQKPPRSPPRSPPEVLSVSSVEVHASSEPAVQAAPPAAVSDAQKEMPVTHSQIFAVGRGCTMGGCTSPTAALPPIGRGFLLQLSQAQIPRVKNVDRAGKTEEAPSFSSQAFRK